MKYDQTPIPSAICQADNWFQLNYHQDSGYWVTRVVAWVATSARATDDPQHNREPFHDVVGVWAAGSEGLYADTDSNHVGYFYGEDQCVLAPGKTWAQHYATQAAPEVEVGPAASGPVSPEQEKT